MRDDPAVPIETLLAQRGWVRALARTLVADPAAADDLEQQAWVEALERPPAHAGGLRGWFATVLRRRARDRWREEGRRTVRESASARPEGTRPTADVVAEADAHRRLVDAVMALEEPYRTTILLRFFEDLPPRDVAARQRVPAETVRTRARRGLDMLRDRLGGRDRSTAFVAVLAPLTTVRWESAAVTGGTVMASKAAVGAVVAAAIVGGMAGGLAVQPSAPGPDPVPEMATLRARLDALEARPSAAPAATTALAEERFEAIQARITRLEERPPVAVAPAVAPVPPTESAIERAERDRKAKDGADAIEAARAANLDARKAKEALDTKVADLRAKLLDRSLADADRLDALSKLRFLPGGVDAPVASGVCSWFREASAAGTRDTILREIHNTKFPEFQALFLDALRSDADETVRQRAAGDIDVYLDDAAVVQALEAARDGDASESVRKKAARTLEKKGKMKD